MDDTLAHFYLELREQLCVAAVLSCNLSFIKMAKSRGAFGKSAIGTIITGGLCEWRPSLNCGSVRLVGLAHNANDTEHSAPNDPLRSSFSLRVIE